MPTVQIGTLVLSVEHLHGRRYVVRPPNALGTCGFYPYTWEAIWVTAADPNSAARKAYPKAYAQYRAAAYVNSCD